MFCRYRHADEDRDRKVALSEDRTKYQGVAPGDLVYNMMRAWQGAFGAFMVAASLFVIASSLFAIFVSVPCVRDRVVARCGSAPDEKAEE